MTNFSKKIPLARDSTPDEPRSYWDRLLMEEAAAKVRSAKLANSGRRLPQPDPNTKFKVTTIAPAISMKQGDSGRQLGIKLENGYPTYRPDAVQKRVIKEYLTSHGMPASQVDSLKFVPGLDKEASIPTRLGYHGGGGAVTQGDTVYVHPEDFVDVVQFNSPTPFEEAYHSAQFEADGGAGFYRPYVLGIVGGILSGKGNYQGIPYEAFAHGAANEMYKTYAKRSKGKQK
ncbi:hypothetical protein [Rhizorhabdus histidinilytica]|uniref:hypothetical protein n=1 Tax=Rhizorhabdus histidinilytica TaxID=439228 RepID=UPI00321FCD5B